MSQFDIGDAKGKTQEQKVAEPVRAGIHDVEINKAYIRKTDSGASMLELSLKSQTDDREFQYATCVRSGDAKGNKTTYEDKNGNVRALPGVSELVAVTKLITGKDAINVKDGQVKHYDDSIDAKILEDFTGAKLKVGVKLEESYYQGNLKVKPIIYQWMTLDGNNEKGELVEEKVAKAIEKQPIKKAVKPQANPSDVADAAQSGW